MTKYLSEHAGGGYANIPNEQIMSKYVAGDAGYYSYATNFETTGNAFTWVVEVQVDVLTGHVVIGTDYPSNYAHMRCTFRVDDDGSIRAFGNDSSASSTKIFDLNSTAVINDGDKHLIHVAYNAATGDSVMFSDGVSILDVGHADHLSSVATLTTSANGNFAIGSSSYTSSTQQFEGNMGLVSYDDQYISDPDVFWDSVEGVMIEPDTDTWSQWGGSAPLVFQRNGIMTNSIGSQGGFTYNETIELYDPPTPHLGLNTTGDAVAGAIGEDLIAWVNGIRLVGTGPVYVPPYVFPTPSAYVAAYDRVIDGFGEFGDTIDLSLGTVTLAYKMYCTGYGTYGAAPVGLNNNMLTTHGYSSGLWRTGFDTTNYWDAPGHALQATGIVNKLVNVVITIDSVADSTPNIKTSWKFDDDGIHNASEHTNPGVAFPKVDAKMYFGRAYPASWHSYHVFTGQLTDVVAWNTVLPSEGISAYLDNEYIL